MGSTFSDPPGTLITDLYPLTPEQMLDFRRMWIRDLVTTGGLDSVEATSPGSGYVDLDPFIVTGGGGSGAAGYIRTGADGAIVSTKVTATGKSYVSPTITAPTGSGAVLTPTVLSVKLSAYNKAFGVQYVSDADVNALLYSIVQDRQDELIAAYLEKYGERLHPYQGTPDVDATAKATSAAEQISVLFHWLRAEIRQSMLADPGFNGSIVEHARDKFFKNWTEQIASDRAWARGRSGGYASVEILRR